MLIDHLITSSSLWNYLPINLRSIAPDTHTTPHQSSALLLPTLAEHSLFLVISYFRASNPPLHSFLPSIISLLFRVSLPLSRPPSFNQYSSRTNANKHLIIHHHLRLLVSRRLYKALLYFTLLYTLRPPHHILRSPHHALQLTHHTLRPPHHTFRPPHQTL